MLLTSRESLNLDNIFGSEEWSDFFREDNDIVRQEDGTEGSIGVSRTLGGKTAVVTHDLNSVPGLCVNEGAEIKVKNASSADCNTYNAWFKVG